MASGLALFIALCGLLRVTTGFNLDPLSPTIVNSALSDLNDNIRQFGFDVAQHEFPDGRKVALVSAPRDNITEFEAEGGVYLCPMEHNADCEPALSFLSHDNIHPFPSRGIDAFDHNLDFQLMGYRIRSFPEFNRVAACAPAYRSQRILRFIDNATNTRYYTANYEGRCVILDSNLTNVLQVTRTDLISVQLGGLDFAFFPLRDPVVVQRPDVDDGDVALVVSSAWEFGNPPPGRLITILAEEPSTLGRPRFDYQPPQPEAEIMELESFNIELGFFTNTDFLQPQIVVSAPRFCYHQGRLRIFAVNDIQTIPLVQDPRPIDGVEPNGYFGYDIAVFDWNHGGYHSIVAGCPLCDGDRGVVFVHVHSGVVTSLVDEPWSSIYRVFSPSTPGGRFGTTVANMGDIDGDGFDDAAISAPYSYDGAGAVYIYRGFSNGLVPDFYQELRAVPGARAFGYAMRADLDIDDNGYRDLTVTDLSGNQVTTFRGSPLVNVQLDFSERKDVIDLTSDRRCSISSRITLLCFDVIPCFQYSPVKSGQPITRFAIRYNVTVDADKQRAQLLEGGRLRTNFISEEIVLTSDSAMGQFFCRETPLTFVIRDDFVETSSIPVQLSVQNADQLLELESDPNAATFGGPLHPTLNRFASGDEPAELTIGYDVAFNVSCGAEGDPEICEPQYEMTVDAIFNSTLPSDNRALVLARDNRMSFIVEVTNTAGDEGLSPLLRIDVPPGILFLNESEPLTDNAFTTCDSPRQERVECQLQNPIGSGTTIRLMVSFQFDERAVLATLPDMNTRSFTFSLIDALADQMKAVSTQELSIRAIADYFLNLQVGSGQYQAERLPVQEPIPFNSIGPEVSFNVLVSNDRPPDNGTLISRSTLIIHLPIILETQEGPRPLLVPTEIVSQGRSNCTHYNSIPEVPQEFNIAPGFPTFLDAWTGPPPAANDQCNSGAFRCGIILCTVEDLEPRPPPSQITIFARLFSPSVIGRFDLTVYATLENDNQLPEVERTVSESSFELIPAVLEVQVDCIRYWIVVVSVVVGIAALTVIIFILGCLGVFRRWYKVKKEEEEYDLDQTDTGLRHRTIPPIAGITHDRDDPELLSYRLGDVSAAAKEKEAEAEMEQELERERERSRERELQLQMEMAQFTSTPKAKDLDSRPSTTPPAEKELDEYKYDQSKGIEDGYEGPETEI